MSFNKVSSKLDVLVIFNVWLALSRLTQQLLTCVVKSSKFKSNKNLLNPSVTVDVNPVLPSQVSPDSPVKIHLFTGLLP